MNEKNIKLQYKKENLRLLRRFLGMTQKEFISRFLCDEDEKASMSIATLSNLESKGGERLNEVILKVCDCLGMDSTHFYSSPEEFTEKLELIIPKEHMPKRVDKNGVRAGNINQNLNRLTMYFAEQIFEKKLKKGDKIESDRVLATKLNIGRSAVREALKVLDVLGMIDIKPGQGMYISNNEKNFFIVPLSWSLFLNGSQVDSIIEVRNLLEIKAAELAASSIEQEHLNRLHEITHRMHTSYIQRDYKAFLRDDIEFHGCIAECGGNQVIYSMLQTISNLMRYVSGTGMVKEEQIHDIYEEHQKIYGFILAQDGPSAAEAMRYHLEKSVLRYDLS